MRMKKMVETLYSIVGEAERQMSNQLRSGNLDDGAVDVIFENIYKKIDETILALKDVVMVLAGGI